MTVPWAENNLQKDILHFLLDVAVDIPAFLGDYDAFKSSILQGKLPQDELVSMQNKTQATAITLDQRLQLWHSIHASNYEHGYVTEKSAAQFPHDSTCPRFHCRDVITGEISQPSVLVYPDLLLATTMCLYRALRLVVAGADNDGFVVVLSPPKRYRLAVDICRSIPYYLHTVPGFLVSRLMFVLRVAFDTFSEGTIEREFIQQLFGHIGEKYHFRVFQNQCSESSTAVRANRTGSG
jgi:hypothetical protein